MDQNLINSLTARAMQVMGSHDDYSSYAEDIAQDAIVRLLERGIVDPEEQHRLGYVTVTFLAKNFMRDERNRRSIENTQGVAINRELDGSREYMLVNPFDVMTYEEMRDRLDNLSPLLRETVGAHYIDGKTVDQIAADEGVSEDRIYKRLQRARDEVIGE